MYMVFIDIDKVYDRVFIGVFMEIFGEKMSYYGVYGVIQDMYNGVKIRVRIVRGDINRFLIDVGLYQRFILSFFLFVTVIDELTINI